MRLRSFSGCLYKKRVYSYFERELQARGKEETSKQKIDIFFNGTNFLPARVQKISSELYSQRVTQTGCIVEFCLLDHLQSWNFISHFIFSLTRQYIIDRVLTVINKRIDYTIYQDNRLLSATGTGCVDLNLVQRGTIAQRFAPGCSDTKQHGKIIHKVTAQYEISFYKIDTKSNRNLFQQLRLCGIYYDNFY